MASFSDNDLNSLEAFATQVARITDVEALCWEVQEPIAHFGFYDCVMYVREGNILTQMSATGPKRLSGNQVAERIALTVGQGIVGSVATTGEVALIDDVSKDPRYIEDVTPGRSELAVPIRYRDEVIGVLDSEHLEASAYGEREVALLERIADLVAPHLGPLLEQRDFRGAFALSEVAAELAKLPSIGTGEVEQALRYISERAARTLRASRVNVWTFDQAENKIRCIEHFDLHAQHHDLLGEVDLDPLPAYAKALAEERVIIANEVLEDPRTAQLGPGYLVPNGITAMLDAPIRVSGRVAGVLCVEHQGTPRRWALEEASFVATLSDYISIAFLQADKARTERQLLHAQKLESLGRLASGVAHDFNNLLTVLGGSVESLLDSATLVPEDRETVRLIGEAGERAGRLTRQLLALGRQQTLSMRRVDLQNVVTDVAALLQSAVPSNVRLLVEPGDQTGGRPIEVLCDRDQIEQVVTNLVLNAADANPAGGDVTVRLSKKPSAEGVLAALEVVDRGTGIAPEDLDAIFEPFYTTKGERGSGLGLAVSLGIVHQHEGRLEVRSDERDGTTFTVLLPLAEAPSEQDTASITSVAPPQFDQPVVVVEDEPGVRQVMQQMLELLGVDAHIAESADQALQMIGSLQPPLLISDVVMPDLNGPELYRKAREVQPQLKVLFVSGYSQELLGDLPYPSSDHAFLGKPFTVRTLGDALTALAEEPSPRRSTGT